jgi:hypothetical protein
MKIKNFWLFLQAAFSLLIVIAGFIAIWGFTPNDFFHGYNGKVSLTVIWVAISYVLISRLFRERAPVWLTILLAIIAFLLFAAIVLEGNLASWPIAIFKEVDVILTIAPIVAIVIFVLHLVKNEAKAKYE